MFNCEYRLPWLAAMRLELVVRKSSQLWRRTDDAHSTCVLRPIECAAEVLFCRHYVLWQCTDETSAYKPTITNECLTRAVAAMLALGRDFC